MPPGSQYLPQAEADARRREIRSAIRKLRARGLRQAATWAAELIFGLPPRSDGTGRGREAAADEGDRPGHGLAQGSSSSSSLHPIRDARDSRGSRGVVRDEKEEEEESDAVALGRLYLEGKEYRRAAHVLRNETGSLAFFLRNYSLLLAGEKRKEEEIVEQGQLQPGKAPQATNGELPHLLEVLEAEEKAGRLDSFGHFLHGLVLVKRDQAQSAIHALCRSVNLFPWNWSAWTELQGLSKDPKTYESILAELEPHWMRSLWEVSSLVELHKNSEGIDKCASLAFDFPQSLFLASSAATARYNLRDFDTAELMFEAVLKADPFRVDGLDHYSNILYVKEKFAELSHLAHQLVLVDKYRPETCCVIGNYFSLKGRHERAVVYFRRALKLDRTYLSAWTLMGHEYVEMKNTPAAIEAYRNAVDINPRDYRAWYGLRQTYEILALPYYALYYYRKATELRPHDARMWCALGQCYESEHVGGAAASGGAVAGAGQMQVHKAIRCYERAYQNNDADGIALHKLATLNQALGRMQTAAFYFRKNLERLDAEGAGGPEHAEALLFLGNFHRNTGQLDLAEQYCSRLLDVSGPSKEEAKALLRDIRSQRESGRQQRQAAGAPSGRGTPQGQRPAPGGEAAAGLTEAELEGLEDDAAMDMGDTP